MLFGPVLGLFVTLGATVGTAIITSLIGRRAGRQSARALLGDGRADRLDRLIERRGLWAVVGQRFIPGVSDALASYAFGAFGVPLWQMAVGAFIGSVPRAFVYTALGASIGDLSSPLAYAAVAIWCVTAVIGAFATHRGYRHWRSRDEAADGPGTVRPTKGDLTPGMEGHEQWMVDPPMSPGCASSSSAPPRASATRSRSAPPNWAPRWQWRRGGWTC